MRLAQPRCALTTVASRHSPSKQPVSWDFLQWTAEWEELAKRADAICFGSLAQRSAVSAATIEQFLQSAPENTLRICDVNLRQFFYSQDVLRKSFRHAHIAKLNEPELVQLAKLLNLGAGSDEALAKRLLDECGLRLVCVTRGDRGSLLVSQTETVEHRGFHVEVADAIGAGDAFTACLAHYYLRGQSLENVSEFANRVASWVATQRGATPPVSARQLQEHPEWCGRSIRPPTTSFRTRNRLGRKILRRSVR